MAAWLCLALVLAVGALYWPVAHHEFLNYDDGEYVTNNLHARSGLSRQNLVWAFTSVEASNWHPVTWISHMLDCRFFGLNPAEAHLANVLLHAVNAVLLFLLLWRGTGALWRSLLVAALFAVHPLNVETVAWVAERKSLLSLFFTLLTIGAYGHYVRRPRAGRYLLVLAAFLPALMSKPMAVTVPAILLVLDYWPLARFTGGVQTIFGRWRKGESAAATAIVPLLLEKAPLFLMSAFSAVITLIAQKSGGSVAPAVALPLPVRIENAAFAAVEYIRKMFWPADLAVFYPHPGNSLAAWKVLVALAVLACLAAAAIGLRRRRFVAAGVLIYLVALLPVAGIIQVGKQAMADRYAYLPLIGLFIVVVWGLDAVAGRLALGCGVRGVAAAAAVLVLAWTAGQTLQYWRNSVSLFTRARQLASRPDPVIENNLGQALFLVGRQDEALEHFKLAVALDRQNAGAYYNIGTIMLVHGQLQNAIGEFRLALQYAADPEVKVSANNNLGLAALELGDFAQAEERYSAALHLDSRHLPSLLGRGRAAYGLADYRGAAQDFSSAATIDAAAPTLLWLGKCLEAEGDRQGALAAYRNALRRDPGLAEANARRSALLAQGSSSPR